MDVCCFKEREIKEMNDCLDVGLVDCIEKRWKKIKSRRPLRKTSNRIEKPHEAATMHAMPGQKQNN